MFDTLVRVFVIWPLQLMLGLVILAGVVSAISVGVVVVRQWLGI